MIGLISDIHGNFVALTEVLKAVDEMGISDIYCAGDTSGYYSQVNEVCDELRVRNVKAVMGNHDWYIAADSFCSRSKTVNECIQYQKKIITDDNLRWLRSLPLHIQVDGLSIVHGGWTDPIDEYLKPSRAYFDNVGGRYFVSGHTHVQQLTNYGDKVYCNPGSVGQPRDGDNRAAFATWDGAIFELHRVAYDFKKVGELMESAGFDGYYYERLAIGAKHNGRYGQENSQDAKV
jgi:predicted phosphodiesterase